MQFHFDNFWIDEELHCLYDRKSGSRVESDERMVSLLLLLAKSYPEHCDPNLLLKAIWPQRVVSYTSLTRLVSDTRNFFKQHYPVTSAIQTLHGRGYALSHELAEQMQHGEAKLRRQPNHSFKLRRPNYVSLFTIGFCLVICLIIVVQLQSDTPSLTIAEASDSKARLLWVDDNHQNNQEEISYLMQQHYAVYQVQSTEEALMLLSMYNYDLVISDMGRQDDPLAGLKLVAEMRKRDHQTAFILYTILPSDAQKQLLQQHGGQAVAVEPNELYQWISLLTSQAAETSEITN